MSYKASIAKTVGAFLIFIKKYVIIYIQSEKKGNKNMTAYCSLTYLFSFTAKELGLSENASPAEIEAAAEIFMEKITDSIMVNTGFIHNDCEISVS